MTTTQDLRRLLDNLEKQKGLPLSLNGCGDPGHEHDAAICYKIRDAHGMPFKGKAALELTALAINTLPALLDVVEAAEAVMKHLPPTDGYCYAYDPMCNWNKEDGGTLCEKCVDIIRLREALGRVKG